MVEEHARRTDLVLQDVRFMFTAGDLCLLRAPGGGKLKRRAVGPYTFARYVGWRGVNAEIVSAAGKRLTVSAANLRPMDPRTHVDCYACRVEQGGHVDDVAVDDEGGANEAVDHGWLEGELPPDMGSATLGSSFAEPPGVVVVAEW